MGWDGIGSLLGKISEQFQSRVERLKNEKAKLEKERDGLYKLNFDVDKKEDRDKAYRLGVILDRIDVINGLLESNAKG